MTEATPTVDRLAQVEEILGPCVVISVTATMLEKSIIDAIEPFRNLLLQTGIHDYAAQAQGQDSKVMTNSMVLCEADVLEAPTSFYRPPTKNGDPRFWIYGLGRVARAGDQFAVTVGVGGQLLVVFLTRDDWDTTRGVLRARFGPLAVAPEDGTTNPAFDELIGLLQMIAVAPPLRGLLDADTSVGRTLEAALGISMNPSKLPDFKGIELKFKRQRPPSKATRLGLFAQVPNWEISPCKSSAEILDNFGYDRDGVFKLYVEVGAKPNSRGLSIRHDAADAWIEEISTKPEMPVVARWEMSKLAARLREKHRETAWVKCESTRVDGVEYFRPTDVIYTSSPRVDLFPLLVGSGDVTLDHLIKRVGKSVNEKGPQWKLEPHGYSKLFAGSRSVSL